MIVTRTPFRITLGGGGTDLPAFYRRTNAGSHGYLVAGAIDKYVYISVNQHFQNEWLMRYSTVEHVSDPSEIQHPILHEIVPLFRDLGPIELSVMADVPAGTGLGSSSAFTVGVLHALHSMRHDVFSAASLAHEACEVEITMLKGNLGKQDQYITAIGGVTAFSFDAKHPFEVAYASVAMSTSTRKLLEENLLLFYTGMTHDAEDALKAHPVDLAQSRRYGRHANEHLRTGDLEAFGAGLTDQWDLKLQSNADDVRNQVIDLAIHHGINAGALGGKLVGAGHGGFLLFYTTDHAAVRGAMDELELAELPFTFDYAGSQILVR